MSREAGRVGRRAAPQGVLLALLLTGIVVGTTPAEEPDAGAWALSVRQLQERLAAGQLDPETPLPLRVIDGVFFSPDRDIVLVGRAEGLVPIVADDIILALRAMWLTDEPPGVSIDPQRDPGALGGIGPYQTVVYFGGIENTRAGLYAYSSDYWMKRLAAGTVSAPVPGFKRYSDLIADADHREEGANRFWFYPAKAEATIDPGGTLMVFDRHGVEVLTETEFAVFDAVRARPELVRRDPLAERFARAFTEHYDELSAAQPDLGRLKNFFALCEVFRWSEARGLRGGRLRLYDWSHLVSGYVTVPVHTTSTVRTVRGEVPGGVLIGGVSIHVRLPPSPHVDRSGRLARLAAELAAQSANPTALAWRLRSARAETSANLELRPRIERTFGPLNPSSALRKLFERLALQPLWES
jgi:hypothetical protein